MAWEENSRICLHMQLIAILSRIGVCTDVIRFICLSYDIQEYIFVHPEEWYWLSPFFGIYLSRPLVLEKTSRSLEALRLQPLGEPPQCFQWY